MKEEKKFEELFPSLKGKIERMWYCWSDTRMVDEDDIEFKETEGETDYYDSEHIKEHCLDKQRVKEIIENIVKYHNVITTFGKDCSSVINVLNEVLKELGLEE